MTVEQFSRILADARQLVECLEMDGLWLTISGGEPLTNNWIWDMLQLAQGPDIKGIAIITNGTLINQETAKLMESLGISEVMISLDGASAQPHDAIRGQGSFARAMRGVEILYSTIRA